MNHKEAPAAYQTEPRGVAIVEFALVLPLVFGLLLLVFETARYIKVAQTATAVARTTANTTYRLCADIPYEGDAAALRTSTEQCIHDQILTGPGAIAANVSTLLPSGTRVTLTVNVYRKEFASQIASQSTGSERTGFAVAGNGIRSDAGVSLSDLDVRERAVSVEVHYPFESWFYDLPYIGGVVFANSIRQQEYYAAFLL